MTFMLRIVPEENKNYATLSWVRNSILASTENTEGKSFRELNSIGALGEEDSF